MRSARHKRRPRPSVTTICSSLAPHFLQMPFNADARLRRIRDALDGQARVTAPRPGDRVELDPSGGSCVARRHRDGSAARHRKTCAGVPRVTVKGPAVNPGSGTITVNVSARPSVEPRYRAACGSTGGVMAGPPTDA